MTDSTRDRLRLFLCSFTILFVELTCIRWIPAYVRSLGFFTNFVLLGSFLGIGLGILQARRRVDLQTLFPVALAIVVAVVALFKIQLTVDSTREVFFAMSAHGTESFLVLPLIFGGVTVLFALLGQNLGRLLAAVRPPLTAYTLDVMGSIAGSVLFAVVSFLDAPPAVWFGIGALGAPWRYRSGADAYASPTRPSWPAWWSGSAYWAVLPSGRPTTASTSRTLARAPTASRSTALATRLWVRTPCA